MLAEKLPADFFAGMRDFRVQVELHGIAGANPICLLFECPIELKRLFGVDQEAHGLHVKLTLIPDRVVLNTPFFVSVLITNDSQHLLNLRLTVEHFLERQHNVPQQYANKMLNEWLRHVSETPAFLCLDSSTQSLGVIKSNACREVLLKFVPLKPGEHFLPSIKLMDCTEDALVMQATDLLKISVHKA